MKRMTWHNGEYWDQVPDEDVGYKNICARLAAYENTGLDPEGVLAQKRIIANMNETVCEDEPILNMYQAGRVQQHMESMLRQREYNQKVKEYVRPRKMDREWIDDLDEEVILTLAECSMNVAATAKAMQVKRHEVDAWIKQIQDKTGRDPRAFFDLVELMDIIHGWREEESDTSDQLVGTGKGDCSSAIGNQEESCKKFEGESNGKCPSCGSKNGVYAIYTGRRFYNWDGDPGECDVDMTENQRKFARCVDCGHRVQVGMLKKRKVLMASNDGRAE